MVYKITKTVLIIFLLTYAIPSQAQDNSSKIRENIAIELRNAERVYTPSGKYNRVLSFKFISNSVIEIDQFYGVIKPGESESASTVSYNRIRIDMSKVDYIEAGRANYGYNCTILGGSNYPVKSQQTDEDTRMFGNSKQYESVGLAVDNTKLIQLFKTWSELCK